jgi:hypothetical protein
MKPSKNHRISGFSALTTNLSSDAQLIECEIGPAPMNEKKEPTLAMICSSLDHQLELADFDENKLYIDQGGFSEVFLVRCMLNNKDYAMKRIAKDNFCNSEFKK